MFIFRHGAEAVQLAYINARGKTLQQSMGIQTTGGWTEAMFIYKSGSEASQLAYIQACGKKLQHSIDIQDNNGNTHQLDWQWPACWIIRINIL